MKLAYCKYFQKSTLWQNVRLKVPNIHRVKIVPKSTLAVMTNIKDEDFYYWYYIGKKKRHFLNNEGVGTG